MWGIIFFQLLWCKGKINLLNVNLTLKSACTAQNRLWELLHYSRKPPTDFERNSASLIRRLNYELCGRKTQVHSMPMFTALSRRDITKSWHRLPTILATNEFSRVLNRYIMYFLYLYMLIGQIYRLLSNTIYEEFILMMPALWKSNCKLPNPWGQQGRW